MNDVTELRGTLLRDEPLAKYTSWRVGGPAEKLYQPADKEDLLVFLRQLPETEPLFWLGLGSNLLVRDGGIRGTVISTRRRLKVMRLLDTTRLYVEVGVPCAHVARYCSDLGLSGAEFLAGIPGTMGGALKMNAGAFGGETWDIVDIVETVDRRGRVSRRTHDGFEVAYRSVKGFGDEWFIAVELSLIKGESVESQQKIRDLLERRSLTQPTTKPTCGSVFKNPQGDYAARLIEDCGLKGYCIGGARVSEKHANFIENTGRATAADIEALVTKVQQLVWQKHGVELQTEFCCAGETL